MHTMTNAGIASTQHAPPSSTKCASRTLQRSVIACSTLQHPPLHTQVPAVVHLTVIRPTHRSRRLLDTEQRNIPPDSVRTTNANVYFV